MQTTDLKFPGDCTHGKTIRREVAYEISQVEIAVQQGAPIDTRFAGFLADAAAKTPGYVPVLLATQAIVSDGGTVNVENSAGNLDSPATATVAAGVLSGVKLAATKSIVTDAATYSITNSANTKTVVGTAVVGAGLLTRISAPANEAIVASGGAAVVQNSAGTTIPGTHPRAVSLGVENNIKLAATVGVVVHGVAQTGWTVTGTGTTFTPTVVAGVCTGGVLS